MTVHLQLMVPALTPGARQGVVGAVDGLNEHGRQAVAQRAQTWPAQLRATCAPERACLETAELIGLGAEVDVEVRDWDLGGWVGRSLTEIATTSPQDLALWTTDPDFAGHGGESLHQLRSRVTRWLDKLDGDGHPRQVTVASTGVVRAVVLSVLDAPTASFWRLDLEPLTSVHISLRPGRRAVRWPA